MAQDLQTTSFYDGDRIELLKGPKGEKGDQGPQGPVGPAGPALPLPVFSDNAAAITAGRALETLYRTPTGEVRAVI